jgi:hypothetical protein
VNYKKNQLVPFWNILKANYDQIGIFFHDTRWPSSDANYSAGTDGKDSFNNGVFDFAELISKALYSKKVSDLLKTEKEYIYNRCEWDISDHMPAWIRNAVP